MVLAAQEEVEVVCDGLLCHVFGCREEFGLGLGVAHGLYAAVPAHGVDGEEGLRERQRHRECHVAVSQAAELAQEVERGAELQRGAGEAYVLLHGQGGVELQGAVAHEGVAAVGVHVGRILVGVRRQRGLEHHFGQAVGAPYAPLAVGAAQAVEGHGSVDAFHSRNSYGVVEGEHELLGSDAQRHKHHKEDG